MILINKSHQLLKTMLRLQSLLLGLSIFVRLLLVHSLLVLVAVLSLIEPDLNCDQVRVHTMNHVFPLPLDHLGLIMLILDLLQSIHGRVESVGLAAYTIFDRRLLNLRLLQLSLLLLEFAFLRQYSLVNIVVLLTDSTQRRTDFFGLFISELPRWNHIVGLEKGVAWHKVVLCSEIIIPTNQNRQLSILGLISNSNKANELASSEYLPILLASSHHLLLILLACDTRKV